MISPYSLTSSEFCDTVKTLLNKGSNQALILYKSWIRSGSIPFDHPNFKNCRPLIKNILNTFDFYLPKIARTLEHNGLKKFWLEVEGGLIESVIIPMSFGYSLCVSSQVGCKMGCTFCQTGRMGLIRNLSAAEIVSQLFIAQNILDTPIRNIVFMGMGEPFDNFDEVKKAISVMTDELGFGIGPRHITISTSGRIDGITRMQKELPPQINLAISVNAPNESVRLKIMPVTRKYSFSSLRESLLNFVEGGKRTLLAEYVLLAGINDAPEQADELAHYLKDLHATVNLIPYNPQDPDRYKRPDEETVNTFRDRLKTHGLQVFVRTPKGTDVMAACGQLGIKKIKAN